MELCPFERKPGWKLQGSDFSGVSSEVEIRRRSAETTAAAQRIRGEARCSTGKLIEFEQNTLESE